MSVLGEITQVSPARLPSDSSSAEKTSSREAAGGYEYGVSYNFRIARSNPCAENGVEGGRNFAERVLAIHRCARLSTRPPPWRPASGPKAKPQRVA